MVRGLSSLLLVLLIAGCASAAEESAPPAATDVAGTYAFTTLVQGSTVEGQLQLNGSPGEWGGSIWSSVTGELPLTSVEVDGQQVRIAADTPNGPVEVRLVLAGETFTGHWSLGDEGGAIRGRRVPD